MANTGGRQKFIEDSRVRILLLTGEVSSDIWLVTTPPQRTDLDNLDAEDPPANTIKTGNYVRADRKGHIFLRKEHGTKEQKVHFRRVLPVDVGGKAPVIESGDKYRAVCPGCGRVETVDPNCDVINCSECGETQVHWLGDKPMTEATETAAATTDEATATATATAKPKAKKAAAPKKDRVVREAIKVNFTDLKGLGDCELWTKGHVKFDHPDVDVQAHALLFVNGEASRKLCFNTYDGALGKKAPPLPIDEFVSDGKVTTGKREKPWFAVKDLDKARAKLVKDGYEQQK